MCKFWNNDLCIHPRVTLYGRPQVGSRQMARLPCLVAQCTWWFCGTKPLPGSMLICHQWSPVAFIAMRAISLKILETSITRMRLKMISFKIRRLHPENYILCRDRSQRLHTTHAYIRRTGASDGFQAPMQQPPARLSEQNTNLRSRGFPSTDA